MKRIRGLFILSLLFLIFGVIAFQNILAKEVIETVKIGLESTFKNITNLKINNKNINLSFSNSSTEIESQDGFNISIENGHYLRSINTYKNYSEANHQASLINYSNPSTKAYPAFLNNSYYILVGNFKSENDALTNLNISNNLEYYKTISVLLINGNNSLLTDDLYNLKIEPNDNNFINLNGQTYRGSIGFNINDDKFTVYNTVRSEEYLYSVVPSEMPSSWHIEALKAQTIAARSYLYYNINNHEKSGYDLCDTTHCQVYKGTGSETEKTTKAVKETANQVAYYNNKPINAVFFSSSGGITDNSENTWTSEVPYLKAVLDSNEKDSKTWSRTITMDDITSILNKQKADIGTAIGVSINRISNERILEMNIHGTKGIKVLKGEQVRTFFSSTNNGSLLSRYFRINENIPSISSNPIISKNNNSTDDLDKKPGLNNIIDSVLNVINKDGTSEANISELYIYENGEVKKFENEISILDKDGLIDLNNDLSKLNNLPNVGSKTSSNLQIYTGTLTINGIGWGHGVGLSQYGSKGMAESGYTYDQIVSHYYSNVVIR